MPYLSLRLSVLFFAQYFIWGSWYLTISLYMIEHGMADSFLFAYKASPLAALAAPFVGVFADRYLNAEKLLCGLFLGAGVCMLLLPWSGSQENSGLFRLLLALHLIFYMPSLALTVALCFRHLSRETRDPPAQPKQEGAQKQIPRPPDGTQRQFPLIRLWGTIGWIVAGFLLSGVFRGEKTATQFYLGGIACVLLGFYALSLPATPPLERGVRLNLRQLFFLDAWDQLRNRSFFIYILSSFLLCIPLAAYYGMLQQQMDALGLARVGILKNLGTIVEAAMMLLMPFFFIKLGIKKVLALGILAWVVRYLLFSGAISPDLGYLVILGILLHGICYDFFFVAGQVYVDKSTPREIRAQAQGLNTFFTLGIGLYFGAIAADKLSQKVFGNTPANDPSVLGAWPGLWLPLAGMAAVVLVFFWGMFREPGNDNAGGKEPDLRNSESLG